jgi:large repetitive protein
LFYEKIYSLLVVLAFLNTTFAQRVFTNYENDSRWFLNLNGGALWHTSDVQNKLNNSWGFMIGKSYNYNYGTLVSFDLRGRYLGGEWLGQDTKLSSVASTDFALNGTTNPNVNYASDSIAFLRNFQTKQRRLALELALHANRFRERTGWDLYVFGGLGLTFWKTHTDALYSTDTSTTMYNYNQLTSFTPVSIAEFQDGTYETPLQGTSGNRYNVDWMPSLGFGIGYQLAPRFQIGFEHKTTFTQTNLWDGKDYNANGASTGIDDLYHYTGFYLKLNFKKRERNYNRPVQTTNPRPTGNNTTTSNNCLHPTVAIVEPFQNYHQVTATTVLVRADISQVQAPHQITFKQNGQFNTNFMFDAATGRFQSTIVLAPGQNSIEISATNACGRAEDSRIVLFNNTINNTPVGAPPIVTYHNPPHSPYTVETSSFALSGQVLNVSSASQIQMTLNGQPFTSFYFNSQTNGITAQLPLIEGTNTVIITGTNTFGTDSKPTVLCLHTTGNTSTTSCSICESYCKSIRG